MGNVSILKASAGSGKTYRLVLEYIAALIEDPYAYRETLAVTFTNKATEEMKQRIVRELGALGSGGQSPYMTELCDRTGFSADMVRERARRARTNILHDYSHFAVLTIDKFFQNIIRSFLRELGISPDFSIELRTDTLLEQAADTLIEQTSTDEGLRQWIEGFVGEQMEGSYGWDVRGKLSSAAKEIFGEQWDFEQADGSGGRETRQRLEEVIKRTGSLQDEVTSRMRHLAASALDLIGEAGLSADDFAYKNSGVAGYLYKIANGDIAPYGSHVRNALESDERWVSKGSPSASQVQALIPHLRPLMEEICRLWDENHRLIYSLEMVRKRFRGFGVLHDMACAVRDLCSEQGIMPIARTNRILQHLIEGNQTPFIFEKAGSRFTRFMIDEFQDTSRVQWENFVPLLQNALAQSDSAPVMLVGDVKQSIYRWRGGDWKILAQEVAGTLGSVSEEPLSTNYRSMENIVRFNNAAISACVEADSRYLSGVLAQAREEGYIPAQLAGELASLPQKAYAETIQTPKPASPGGYVTLTITPAAQKDDAPQEGPDPVITRVEELQRRGYRPSDIAILVRRNDEARRVAAMMLDHKRANPASPYSYDVVTSEALQVGSSPVTEFIAACLSLASDRGDAISRAVWNRYNSRQFHETLPAAEEEFIASLAILQPQEAFHKIIIRYGLSAREDQTAYLQAMHEQVVRFCEQNIADTSLFLRWWQQTGSAEAIYMPQSESAIGIITVHTAKGLERKAVILPYCSWPLGPKADSTIWVDGGGTPFEQAGRITVGFEKKGAQSCFAAEYYRELVFSHIDNINLLYVALTRAREELHIYIPLRKGKEAPESFSTVSDLITAAVNIKQASLGDLQGRTTSAEDGKTVVEFGEPVIQTGIAAQQDGRIRTGYPTRDPGMKVKMRLPSFRYTEDGAAPPALSPRDYGVLMHKVFENASTLGDVYAALAALRQDGSVSADEASKAEELIRASMQNPLVAQWFSGEWEMVRNESDIIVPRVGGRRPDRVMVKGGRAVVVDYKFGEKQPAEHKAQITLYKDLLSKMGYANAEGYLWYVALNEIVKV